MPHGLNQKPLAGVDQNHGSIGGRCASYHVSRVLLMARRISHNESTLFCCKKPIGDVDRDTLFALGRQSVDEQRKIKAFALGAEFL